MFYKLLTLPLRNVRWQIWRWNFGRVTIIKIILLYINTDSQVFIFCYRLKKKSCKCFKFLLQSETLKTVKHYHQKHVHNVTGLHHNNNCFIYIFCLSTEALEGHLGIQGYICIYLKGYWILWKTVYEILWILGYKSSWILRILVQNAIWAASSEFGTYRLCEQRRFRRACASAQSRQNLHCSLI